jgi:hypothetical protein
MSLNCIKHGPVPVDEYAPLWRYVRLPQLLLLLKGELVLPSIRTLQRHDPKEGDRPWDEVLQMLAFDSEPEIYDRLEEFVRDEMSREDRKLFDSNSKDHSRSNQRIVFEKWWETVVSTRFALCFFEAHCESIPMWRHFAPEGVAVRTSLRRLDEALQSSGREWLASRMIYEDLSEEITADRAYADARIIQALGRPYLLKQREYQAENEVRLVTVDPEASAYIRVGGVRPETWIEEIRISPDLWPEDAGLLSQHICTVSPALTGYVRRSAVCPMPTIGESTFAALHAEVNREAAARWPDFLRRP